MELLALALVFFLSRFRSFCFSFFDFIYLLILEKNGTACAPQPGSPTLLAEDSFSIFSLPLSLSLSLLLPLSFSFFLAFTLSVFHSLILFIYLF